MELVLTKASGENFYYLNQRLNSRLEYEGSGIGLIHCQKIIGLHGGKIWVESTLREGSKFHFTLASRVKIIKRRIQY
jgi:light-regulated signal transduction histidine kinase (bacteriophytochrome)